MLVMLVSSALLVLLATIIHYEALRILNGLLPSLKIRARVKLLLVILTATLAHLVEIGVYAIGFYTLISMASVGTLSGSIGFSLLTCLYFSAETYTSLGFGDVMPVGPVRILAGIEALNGLLLIGWSASYTYISMERFWSVEQ